MRACRLNHQRVNRDGYIGWKFVVLACNILTGSGSKAVLQEADMYLHAIVTISTTLHVSNQS